jgi:hypothetical protein
MAQAKTVTLIVTSEWRGRGTADDAFRLVTQLWTLEGTLIAEFDPGAGGSDASAGHAMPAMQGLV